MSQVASFISIAALSGIIGNLTTYYIKKIIITIKNNIRKSKLEEENLLDVIDNDDELEIFIDYIESFYNEFENLKPEIREAIYEEIIVHGITDKITEIMEAKHPDILHKMEDCNSQISQELLLNLNYSRNFKKTL